MKYNTDDMSSDTSQSKDEAGGNEDNNTNKLDSIEDIILKAEYLKQSEQAQQVVTKNKFFYPHY